jgi:hypothetical protein
MNNFKMLFKGLGKFTELGCFVYFTSDYVYLKVKKSKYFEESVS